MRTGFQKSQEADYQMIYLLSSIDNSTPRFTRPAHHKTKLHKRCILLHACWLYIYQEYMWTSICW